MRSREEKIKLLEQVIKGQLPVSVLKIYTLTYFHLMQPKQRQLIEAKLGKVAPSNCSVYNDYERLIGLWEGIPIGFTAMFHLSCFKNPDCKVEIIDCPNEEAFSVFLEKLPIKKLTDQRPESRREKRLNI